MRKDLVMKKMILFAFCFVFYIFGQQNFAQSPRQNKGVFIGYKDEFLERMKKCTEPSLEKEEEKEKQFKMDFTGVDLPSTTTEFRQCWHSTPIPQGITGSCWCFSSTSFFESEIYRLTRRKIKLSGMFTIYWEYVEKARRFVQERGESPFGKGSQPNATIRIWKKYGVVPAEFYEGKIPPPQFHNHSKMYTEMKNYLLSVKEQDAWNEQEVISTIKSILNHYMGVPPVKISIGGKSLAPQEYLKDIVRLNLNDYVDVMSLMEKPYFQKVEYEVRDNWWHSKRYLNVPLNVFMKIIKTAIKRGYSLCIVGDTSESGYAPYLDVAMVPTYDIPAEYIDENARQFRFSNKSTTDDHAIHLVGYLEKNGKDWYLIKDSGSTARNGKLEGYFFYHEDYVRLKMMNFMVHKDIINEMKSEFGGIWGHL